MSADIACPATGDDPGTLEAEAAEHERQLRESAGILPSRDYNGSASVAAPYGSFFQTSNPKS